MWGCPGVVSEPLSWFILFRVSYQHKNTALRLQWGCKVFASDMWCLRPTAVFGKDASGAALSHSEGKTLQNILFINEQLPKNTIFRNRTRQIEDWAHIFRLARRWPRLAPKPTWISHLIKESWFLGANMLAAVFSNTWDGEKYVFLGRDFCRWQNSEVKGSCCITGTYSTNIHTQTDLTHSLKWQCIIALHREIMCSV